MGTICLSLAPILRCESLSRIESGLLLIPTGLELIFSIGLIFAKPGTTKTHLLLSAEGIVYFTLALLDVILHVVPGAHRSLAIFEGIDIFLGITSLVPLVLYTSYLFLYTTTDILPGLPHRFQTISKYTLFAFIPIIAILNELASFISISYRTFGRNSDGTPVIAVGFTNSDVHTFFDALLLVLLVAYQALTFCASFIRLVKAFISQRKIESDPTTSDKKVHLFNGLGWVCAGIKLGAIEPLIGFAQGGFGEALTRRILRFLGRACLIIGVIKGVDTIEDFSMFDTKPRRNPSTKRHSNLRALISNPRNSTFQQMEGYNYQRSPDFTNTSINPVSPATLLRSVEERPISIPNHPYTANLSNRPLHVGEVPQHPEHQRLGNRPPSALVIFPPHDRVVVHQRRNRAPTLILRRMSGFDVLEKVVETAGLVDSSVGDEQRQRRGASHTANDLSITTSPYSGGLTGMTMTAPPLARRTLGPGTTFPMSFTSTSFNYTSSSRPLRSAPLLASQSHASQVISPVFPGRRGESVGGFGVEGSAIQPTHRYHESLVSNASDSLEVVRALAMQFPGIPPRVTSQTRARKSSVVLGMMGLGLEPTLERPGDEEEGNGIVRGGGDCEEGLGATMRGGVARSNSERSTASQKTLTGDVGATPSRSSSVKRKPVPPIAEEDLKTPGQAHTDTQIFTVNAIEHHQQDQFLNLEKGLKSKLSYGKEVEQESEVVSPKRPKPVVDAGYSYTKAVSGGYTLAMANIPPLPSNLPTPTSRISFGSVQSQLQRASLPSSDASHTQPRQPQFNGVVPPTSFSYQTLQTSLIPKYSPHSGKSHVSLEFPWHGKDVSGEAEAELENARRMNGLTKVNSLGLGNTVSSGPKKKTPAPIVVTEYKRTSIVAERFGGSHEVDVAIAGGRDMAAQVAFPGLPRSPKSPKSPKSPLRNSMKLPKAPWLSRSPRSSNGSIKVDLTRTSLSSLSHPTTENFSPEYEHADSQEASLKQRRLEFIMQALHGPPPPLTRGANSEAGTDSSAEGSMEFVAIGGRSQSVSVISSKKSEELLGSPASTRQAKLRNSTKEFAKPVGHSFMDYR